MELMSKNGLRFAECELKKCFMAYMPDAQAEFVAKKAAKTINWDDTALMHKDIRWLARNYMKNQSRNLLTKGSS